MVTTKHEAEGAIGWKLLRENIVYRVDKMCPIQPKWGSWCMLHLRNALGQNTRVWAPNNRVRDLKTGLKLNGKECLAFIKSLGEKKPPLWVNQKGSFLTLKLYIYHCEKSLLFKQIPLFLHFFILLMFSFSLILLMTFSS